MADIFINDPFQLTMDIVNIDDYFSSFQMKIDINISHATGVFKYTADDIWFRTADWDHFIISLKNDIIHNSKCILNDMDDFFSISIVKRESYFIAKLSCKEPFVELHTTYTMLTCERIISFDALGVLQEKFENFPKWW